MLAQLFWRQNQSDPIECKGKESGLFVPDTDESEASVPNLGSERETRSRGDGSHSPNDASHGLASNRSITSLTYLSIVFLKL